MLVVMRGGPHDDDRRTLEGEELEGWLRYDDSGVRSWYRRSDPLEYADLDGQRAELWDYSDSGPPRPTS